MKLLRVGLLLGVCLTSVPALAAEPTAEDILKTYADIALAGYEDALTTAKALDAATDEIGAYLRFLARAGEKVNPTTQFQPRVAEHNKSGGFIGSSFLPTDAEAVSARESEALMRRLDALHAEIRRLTAPLSPARLEAKPMRRTTLSRRRSMRPSISSPVRPLRWVAWT